MHSKYDSKLQALQDAQRHRSFLPEWAYVAAFILFFLAVGLQRWKIYTYDSELAQVKMDFLQYIEASKMSSTEGRETQRALEEMYFRNAADRTKLIEGRKPKC